MSDLARLLAEMRQLANDAATLGEFRDAARGVNYESVNRFMRSQVWIHGGGQPGAGIAVFPLSYSALTMLTPAEQERAYELAWPIEAQVEWSRERQEEFERRFPEAARQAATSQPEPIPPGPRDEAGSSSTSILARVLRRRARRG